MRSGSAAEGLKTQFKVTRNSPNMSVFQHLFAALEEPAPHSVAQWEESRPAASCRSNAH